MHGVSIRYINILNTASAYVLIKNVSLQRYRTPHSAQRAGTPGTITIIIYRNESSLIYLITVLIASESLSSPSTFMSLVIIIIIHLLNKTTTA